MCRANMPKPQSNIKQHYEMKDKYNYVDLTQMCHKVEEMKRLIDMMPLFATYCKGDKGYCWYLI